MKRRKQVSSFRQGFFFNHSRSPTALFSGGFTRQINPSLAQWWGGLARQFVDTAV